MKHTLSELAEISGAALEGDGSVEVIGPAALRDASSDQISLYGHPRYKAELEQTSAAALVVPSSLEVPRGDLTLLRADDANIAFTRIVQVFADERPGLDPGVHPSAVVHPSARLADSVTVGPLAVIGAQSELAAGVVVHAHTVLGHSARVGEGTVIYAGVVAYDGVTIGARCIVHSGTVLGADGYGFEPTPDGWVKVPQVGTVEIGDDVEIGACCTVDRGRFGPTRIGHGTKFDDHVHVAHNVQVGEHVMLAAQVGISGSTRIGSRSMLGGQVGVAGHLTLGEGVKVFGGAGVIGDVPSGGDVWGFPARPKRDVLRGHALVHRLPRLVDRIKQLEQRIEELERGLPEGGDA
jgi:UDP-3-O-[3-hydroxymyristoyl] glucosamine N-acyltransferase